MNLLITGAASGIAACMAELAIKQGHRVIAADVDEAALTSRWQHQAKVTCIKLDVRSQDSWDRLLAQLDEQRCPADVLINVAGVLRSGRVGELQLDDIELMLDVNVKGVILGTNAVAASMIARGYAGHIINIGSLASLYATPGTTIYATSKYAVRGFSIAAAGDLKPHGIAVSLVGPGPVKTAMLELQRGDEKAALTFSGARALTPEEVASAVLGPVMRKRPLEQFIPWHEGLLGKLCSIAPGLFLRMTKQAAERGKKHFTADSYR
ncbi:SDR family oxidoreductase [Pseudomonas sp. LjRoot71]|uniref:SDR family NAD(P)-dependent oxidoreductase n=1 Tax=Pseudomonas sp. LjRoot71 TaxID=3342336 RepID=UPI003ED11080